MLKPIFDLTECVLIKWMMFHTVSMLSKTREIEANLTQSEIPLKQRQVWKLNTLRLLALRTLAPISPPHLRLSQLL